MNEKLVQAVLESVLEGIDFNDFSLQAIVDRVSEITGRPIALIPISLGMLGPGKYACWFEGRKFDFICFEKNAAPVHRNHNIMHELMHILFGHKTLALWDDDLGVKLLTRGIRYDAEEERIAEEMATIIQQRIIHRVGVMALQGEWSSVEEWDELVIRSLQR